MNRVDKMNCIWHNKYALLAEAIYTNSAHQLVIGIVNIIKKTVVVHQFQWRRW